jgi:pyroglutamyl-peptidase
MKILITGFGGFLLNNENPTIEVLKLLPKRIYGHQIIVAELPVVYDECFDVLLPLIEKYKPEIIINLGLAGGRKAISLERVALNINDSKSPDNNGNIFLDKPVILTGENAYFSTLPLKKIMKRIQIKKIPVEISNTAGLYVCNNLMYHVLHYLSQNNLDVKAGFVHVPFMDEQEAAKNNNSLKLAIILEGVIDIVKACL